MKARLIAVAASVAVAVTAFQVPAVQALFSPDEPEAPAARAANGNKLVWARVSSKQPKKAFYNKKTTAPVGRTGGSVNRAYFRMTLEDAYYEDRLTSVRLVVPVTSPNPCRKGGAPAVNVHLTGGISKKTTWKKQPKVVKKLGKVKPKCGSKSLELTLTKAAESAIAKGGDTLTIRLSAANEKNAKGFLKFSNKARLVIRAESDTVGGNGVGADPGANTPTAVEGASFTPAGAAAPIACGAGATRPKIAVATGAFGGTIADADGGFIGLRVEWKPGAAAAAVAAAPPVLSAMQFADANEKRTFAAAAGAAPFADGQTYSWRVQGRDDVAAGAWTGWCEFDVDLPGVPPPVEDDDDDAPPPAQPAVPAAARHSG